MAAPTPAPTEPDILALGEAMVEFNQTREGGGRTYLQGFGGDTSNAAIAAARQGARVGYISALGGDVYGRMLRLFGEMAEAQDGAQPVVRLSQQAIAERVGASRAMVNRIVQDLERGGYIACSRGRIELLRALPKRW